MRAVFFGTPAIAVPALRALHQVADVTAVVCQPDRPAGRGLVLRASAMKLAALELGLPVHQPKAVRTGRLATWLEHQQADVALVMAYGRILPLAVLETPGHGCLNLHASLLPKYRGAAPIQWAIMRGEHETGVSLMRMDEGMDTGPVYCQRSLAIGHAENAEQLAARLSRLAAEVTSQDLPKVIAGQLTAVPQNPAEATYAPPLDKSLAEIHWTQPAGDIVLLIRGMTPRPGAHTRLRGKGLKILRAVPAESDDLEPGEVRLAAPETILVGCGEGSLAIQCAQLEGRRPSDARELINGRVIRAADRLGG